MKKTIILTIIGITVLIITLHVLNNIFVVAPATREMDKKVMVMVAKGAYKTCTDNAALEYHSTWEANCTALDRAENCQLPQDNAKEYNKNLKNVQDNCLELYKLELSAIK